MSGLLGFMAAGAAQGYAQGRGRELEQNREFDLRAELINAQADKQLQLKKAGYEMDDKRAADGMTRNKAYMADVEVQGEQGQTTRPATMQDGFNRAMQDGNLDTAEKFGKAAPKRETYTLSEGQKVVDASGNTIAEGAPKERKIDVNDMILKATQGDEEAKKFLNTLSAQEVKKAIAGRVPPTETETAIRKRDFIDAYSDNQDYVKNGKLTSKGFDKFNKFESDEYQTVTDKPAIGLYGTNTIGKDGKPLMTTSVTRKEKVPDKAKKPWERNY